MRIVSLLPSATEIVCALGADEDLAGISHECDFPASIRNRRVLTRSRIDASGSSRAIDAAVRAAVSSALSIYAVDAGALAALAPDVIITQDLCEVCAVSLDDVRTAVARLAHRDDISIVSLRPTRLDHMLDDIERVAAALDRAAQGAAVRRALSARIWAIAERAARAPTRPRVATLEWLEPLMLGGTWMPDLIALAAGTAVGAAPGAPAPTVDAAALAALDPEVVIIKPCGFSLDRALAERDLLSNLRALLAPRTRLYVTDGSSFFNRPGPRLVDSLEIMAACVHPALFPDFARTHAASLVHLAP